MSKKTKGKAKEERAGSRVSAGLVFGNVKCVTFELVGDFFRALSRVYTEETLPDAPRSALRGPYKQAHAASSALSRRSKIMRRGLQSFNCIVRSTATYLFQKSPHIKHVTEK